MIPDHVLLCSAQLGGPHGNLASENYHNMKICRFNKNFIYMWEALCSLLKENYGSVSLEYEEFLKITSRFPNMQSSYTIHKSPQPIFLSSIHAFMHAYLFTLEPWLSVTSTLRKVPAGWKHLSILKPLWKLELQEEDKVKKGTDICQGQCTFHSINWIIELLCVRSLDYLTHWLD